MWETWRIHTVVYGCMTGFAVIGWGSFEPVKMAFDVFLQSNHLPQILDLQMELPVFAGIIINLGGEFRIGSVIDPVV